MKISVSAAELAGALALAALALDSSIKIEILQAVHIKAADEIAHLTASGADRTVAMSVQAEVAEPGETVVRAAALTGLAAGFKDGTIGIEADVHGAKIRCGRATYRLPVMPLEDLPATPTTDTAMAEIELAREDLLGAIRQVMFAASTEATRFYLNGVCLHDEGAQLVAVAIDGHRLARCRIPSAPFSQDLSCIIPLATIGPLIKLLAKTTGRVKLRRSRTLVEITAPDFVLTSKLIDGTYPDYGRLIPAAPENSATVDRDDLISALARLAAVTTGERKSFPLAGFEWSPTETALRLSLPSQPGVAEDVIAAAITGNAPVATAARLAHWKELVGELRGARICIASNGNRNSILVTDPGNDTILILQMPCVLPARSSQQAA